MKASKTLINAVKGFEGLRLKAYYDSAGVATIGYGHTRGVKMGQRITEAEAEHHPMGHVLTRAVGVDASVRIDVRQVDIAPEDIFLICSDGLTACANEAEIRDVVSEYGASRACARLVEICLDRGAPDNVSIISVICDEVTAVEDAPVPAWG